MFRRGLPPFPKSAYRQYLPLMPIGKGADGQVFLCLSRSDTPSQSSTRNQTVDGNMHKLQNGLVALKVMDEDQESSEPTCERWASDILRQLRKLEQDIPPRVDFAALHTSISTEILAAKRIKNAQEQAKGFNNVPLIKDAHLGSGPWCSWYSMDYIPGCTLRQLLVRRMPLPSWLIAQIFVELVKGLKWMQDRALSHGDLHASNVILGQSTDSGMIKLALIDFGKTTDWNMERGREDCLRMIALIRALVESGRGVDGDWLQQTEDKESELKDQLMGTVQRAFEAESELHSIWERCGALAEKIRVVRKDSLCSKVKTGIEENDKRIAELEALIQKGGEPVDLVDEL